MDFQADVIERSRHVPVVVDFWAPWCGPCRVLGPVLEALAGEAGGRFELVKIDTDRQPDLASDWDVRGIPAVKLFHDGQPVAEFVGALSRREIEDWLAANLPDPVLQRLDAIDRAPSADRVAALEDLLREQPAHDVVRARLAAAIAPREPSRALELVGGIESIELVEAVDDVRALAELAGLPDGDDGVAEAHLRQARAALLDDDLEGALGSLVDAAIADRRHRDDLARRVAVALFHRLGHDDARTREYQRRLGAALT